MDFLRDSIVKVASFSFLSWRNKLILKYTRQEKKPPRNMGIVIDLDCLVMVLNFNVAPAFIDLTERL